MKHTKGKWKSVFGRCQSFLGKCQQIRTVDESHKKGGLVIAWVFGCGAENTEANARLIATAPGLLETCKELADIFPEESMSEMDAADFKDKAHRIWAASQSAKNTIAAVNNSE